MRSDSRSRETTPSEAMWDTYDHTTGQPQETRIEDFLQHARKEMRQFGKKPLLWMDGGGTSSGERYRYLLPTREMHHAQLQQDWGNWQVRQNNLNFLNQQFPNYTREQLQASVDTERANLNAALQQNELNITRQAQEQIDQMQQQLDERGRMLQRLERCLNEIQGQPNLEQLNLEQLTQEHALLTAQSNQLQADRQQWQNERNLVTQTLGPHYTRSVLDTHVIRERARLNTAMTSYNQLALYSNLPVTVQEQQIFQLLNNQEQRVQRLERGLNQTQGQLNQELTEHTERHAQLQQAWQNWRDRQSRLNSLTFLQQRFPGYTNDQLPACVNQERMNLNAALQQRQQNELNIALQAQQEINQNKQQLGNTEQRVLALENGLMQTQEQLTQESAVLTARGNLLGYSAYRISNP